MTNAPRLQRLLSTGLSLVLLLGLLGTGLAQTTQNRLTIALAKDLVTLDPTFAMDNYSQQVIDQVFDTLVTYASDGSMQPRIASSWEQVTPTQWRFQIRDDVVFHNGRALTADDVVWTMQRMLSPETNVPRQHLFMVENVSATGLYEVTFELTEQFAPFLSVLANRALSILPSEVVTERGAEFARNPLGTGPFKFVSWDQGRGVLLERNDAYFLGQPNLQEVLFRAIPETAVAQQQLETGDVDVVADLLPDDIERLQAAGLADIAAGNSYYYALFNLHPETAPIVKDLGTNPFLDRRVREAVILAFPVDMAVQAVYPGLGEQIRAYGPIPPTNWAYTDDVEALWPQPDIERAKALLAEAGYPNGFKTEILSMNDAARLAMAQILQNSLSQIGITASLTSPDFGLLLERANAQTFDIAVFGWGGSPDPHDFVFPLLHTDRRGPGGNNAYYSNAAVDQLIDEASREADPDIRAGYYSDVQQLFMQDLVHIPLFYKPSVLGIAPRVQGLQVDPMGFFRLVTATANVSLN